MDHLDAILLAHARRERRKVAQIVAPTAIEMGVQPTDREARVIVARIRDLVSGGALEAKGSLSRPRFNELRLRSEKGSPPDADAVNAAPGRAPPR